MAERARSVLMVLEATFPKLGGGGAESQVLMIGRSLVGEGVRVRVVVPMVADGPQVARESLHGMEVVRIRYPRIPLLGGGIMLAKLAWMLLRTRREYDAIHAHIAHNMSAVAVLAGRALGKRVVVKLTGMHELAGGILDARAGPASRLRRVAMRRATLVQATSSRLGKALAESGFAPSRILVLPNGVDVDRFLRSRRDEALRQRLAGQARLVGVFVGRLAPEKGLELLVEAWGEAFRGRADAQLVLVGDGAGGEELRVLAARLGIGGQVSFAGRCDDVAPYLAAADFGLLTSFAEGLSNSLLEYMAAGLPVVGSRVSGTEDFVVPGETGWLFEPGRRDELARCLEGAAAAGPEALRRMGEAARARIVAAASREAVTRALQAAYGFAPAATGAGAGAPGRTSPCAE